jgi:F0F1-type ATP synthase membrane subunit c/vacuolar-type H+-ATPase subunit K
VAGLAHLVAEFFVAVIGMHAEADRGVATVGDGGDGKPRQQHEDSEDDADRQATFDGRHGSGGHGGFLKQTVNTAHDGAAIAGHGDGERGRAWSGTVLRGSDAGGEALGQGTAVAEHGSGLAVAGILGEGIEAAARDPCQRVETQRQEGEPMRDAPARIAALQMREFVCEQGLLLARPQCFAPCRQQQD